MADTTERAPEWAGGQKAIHAWREYRPSRGPNAGRPFGSKALCGSQSGYEFDAVWSLSVHVPDGLSAARRMFSHLPVCPGCRDAVADLLDRKSSDSGPRA